MGMMGSGKSTLGHALAQRRGVPYIDNDDHLRHATGSDAATIAREQGVDRLHEIEWRLLEEALLQDDASVVSAPGSVALDADAAERLLAGHHVVWLRARPETLAARVRHDPMRPLLGGDLAESMGTLSAAREPGFRRLAGVVVDVDDRDAGDLVDEILRGLDRPAASVQPGAGAAACRPRDRGANGPR